MLKSCLEWKKGNSFKRKKHLAISEDHLIQNTLEEG